MVTYAFSRTLICMRPSCCSVTIGVDGVSVEERAEDRGCVDDGADRVPNSGRVDGVCVDAGVDDRIIVKAGADDGAGVDEGVDDGVDTLPNGGEVDVVGVDVGVTKGAITVPDDVDASFACLCNRRCMFLCGLV